VLTGFQLLCPALAVFIHLKTWEKNLQHVFLCYIGENDNNEMQKTRQQTLVVVSTSVHLSLLTARIKESKV
jgi:hypothetical protein